MKARHGMRTGNAFIEPDFPANDAATGDFLGFPVSRFPRDDGELELTDEATGALVGAPGDIRARRSRVTARIAPRDGIASFTFDELAG